MSVALVKTRLSGVPQVGGSAFIYREGELTPSGNIYASFAAAYADAILQGVAHIYIDDSKGAPVVRPGVYNLSAIDLIGLQLDHFGNGPTLTFQTGATLTAAGLRSVNALTLASTSTAVVWDANVNGSFLSFTMDHDSLMNGNAAAPFLAVRNGASVFALMTGSGLTRVGGPAVQVDAGGTFYASLYEGASVAGNTVTGAGALQYFVRSPAATVSLVQAGLTTIGVTQQCLAANVKPASGTTAQRPTGLGIPGIGFCYFDTTLGAEIVWTGVTWVVLASAAAAYITSIANVMGTLPVATAQPTALPSVASQTLWMDPATGQLRSLSSGGVITTLSGGSILFSSGPYGGLL